MVRQKNFSKKHILEKTRKYTLVKIYKKININLYTCTLKWMHIYYAYKIK